MEIGGKKLFSLVYDIVLLAQEERRLRLMMEDLRAYLGKGVWC